jgi:sugar lactone lactonase YvrE
MKHMTGATKSGVLMGLVIAGAIGLGVWSLVQIEHQDQAPSGLGAAYQYDISSLAYIDPNLIQYDMQLPLIETGYVHARAVCVDHEGLIWVAGDETVRVFQRDGNLMRTLSSDGPTTCLAVTPQGQIYVGKRDHVDVFGPDFKRDAAWPSLGEDAVITSLAVSATQVFVADAGHREVVVYDLAGQVVSRFGKANEDQGFEGIIVPSAYFDLVLSQDGLLRVVNPGRLRVDAFTRDGQYEFSWGEPGNAIEGFCGCCNPCALAVLPDGRFVTAEKGLMRVKVYNSDSGFEGVVAGFTDLNIRLEPKICKTPDECRANALDVAVDQAGDIYVLDTDRAQVRVFKKRF